MKKSYFALSLLFLMAFVACSNDDTLQEPMAPAVQFTLLATQGADHDSEPMSRVAIDGLALTWEASDQIYLRSQGGALATLQTSDSDVTNDGKSARFTGEGTRTGDAYLESDTYYAVSPASLGMTTSFTSTQTFTSQDGSEANAVLLAGKAEGVRYDEIDMHFTPVNSLLHVTVTGLGAETLTKVTFQGVDNDDIYSSQTYNHQSGGSSYGAATKSLVVANSNGLGSDFYIALPAGQTLNTGYRLTLESRSGKKTLAAYGKTSFPKATISEVEVAWNPYTVTCGARTTYSYYAAVNGVTTKNSSTANSLGGGATANAGSKIFLDNANAVASTYTGIQTVNISDVGFLVLDGTTQVAKLSHSEGKVTWEKSSNKGTNSGSFYLTDAANNPSSLAWKNYTVVAYVQIKNSEAVSASNYTSLPSNVQTVSVTGVPYYADWRANDYPNWKYNKISDKGTYLRVDNAGWFSSVLGCIISPAFYLPSGSMTVYPAAAISTGATSAGNYDRSYMYAGTQASSASESGSYITIAYKAADSDNPSTGLVQLSSALTLTTASPCVVMTAKDFSPATSTNIYQARIIYGE